FRLIFPVAAARPKQLGWDGAYNFQSFRLAGYKMELIESARPASFVERFLARRGEGFHHLAIDVDRLDPLVRRLEADGIGLVGKAESLGGHLTAVICPRHAHGRL